MDCRRDWWQWIKGEVSAFEVKKKKRLPGRTGLIAAALIILVIAYCAVSGIKIVKLNKEREEAEAQKQELLNTKEDLLAQYENINSAEYIERLARRDLKLVKSNELLFILPENIQKENEDDNAGKAED